MESEKELREMLEERWRGTQKKENGIVCRRKDKIYGYYWNEGSTTPTIQQKTRDGYIYEVGLFGDISLICINNFNFDHEDYHKII